MRLIPSHPVYSITSYHTYAPIGWLNLTGYSRRERSAKAKGESYATSLTLSTVALSIGQG